MTVERGKLCEFARAARAAAPDLLNGLIMHPTFLITARLIWEPPEMDPVTALGFDLSRMLHGEEEYCFHASPPGPGDTLQVTSRIARTWERSGARSGRMRFAVVINEFRSPDGTLVAEQFSTMIETASPAE